MEGLQWVENAERFVGATNLASVLREPVERGACVKPRDDGLVGLRQPLRDFLQDETCPHTAWPVEHLAPPQRHTSLHDLGSRPSDRAVGASKRLRFLLLDPGGGPRRVDFPDSPEASRNGTHAGRKNRRCQEKGLLRQNYREEP